jgi:hypothetical protein
MITTSLSVLTPPERRQRVEEEEKRDESSEVPILDSSMSRIVAPLSDYIPLIDEVRSKTSDQICIELATECDRLRVLIENSHCAKRLKPVETSAIVARRLLALRLLSQRLDEVAGREEVQVELATISSVVSIVRDVLRETGVAHETREIVFQKLLSRITAKREATAG